MSHKIITGTNGIPIRVINHRTTTQKSRRLKSKKSKSKKSKSRRSISVRSISVRSNNLQSKKLESNHDPLTNFLMTFKNNHDKIKTNFTNRTIIYDYKMNNVLEQFMPSKLDLLKFALENCDPKSKTPLPSYITNLINQQKQNITNNNLDELNNFVSINSFNFKALTMGGLLGWFDPSNYTRQFGKFKNFPTEYASELSEIVSVQMSENIKHKIKYCYTVTYNDTSLDQDQDKQNGQILLYTLNIIDPKELDELIKKIISNVLIYPYQYNFLKQNLKYPLIRIYMLEDKKELPRFNNYNNQTLFTNHNVNSGLTQPDSNIVIFRKEELLKVLLHECIHYYKIVNCTVDTINKSFKIDSKKNHAINETITEILANVFNTIIISQNYNEYLNNIEIEKNFIFDQAGKILKHCKYEDWNNYCSDDNKDIKIIETTNMHAYFILRALLFNNLNDFLNKLNFSNVNPIDKGKCIEIINNIDEIKTNDSFIKKINEHINKNITNTTLRMTSLE